MSQNPRKKTKNTHSSQKLPSKTQRVNFQAKIWPSPPLVDAFVERCSALEGEDELEFTMKNGINGTVRRLDNLRVHQILAQCRERNIYDGCAKADEFCVVDFRVQGEKIQVLTAKTFLREMAHQAHRPKPDFWQGYWPLFYNGAYVKRTSEEGKLRPIIVACALMCGVPPHIVPLIRNLKSVSDYFEVLHEGGTTRNLGWEDDKHVAR